MFAQEFITARREGRGLRVKPQGAGLRVEHRLEGLSVEPREEGLRVNTFERGSGLSSGGGGAVLRVKPPGGGAGVAQGLGKMAERWAELQEGLVYSYTNKTLSESLAFLSSLMIMYIVFSYLIFILSFRTNKNKHIYLKLKLGTMQK